MSEGIKRREPGKRVFPSRPKLVLVPPAQGVDSSAPKVEPSQEVKEMLREMNQRRATIRNTDAPDAA
jgi:hypothetical protein